MQHRGHVVPQRKLTKEKKRKQYFRKPGKGRFSQKVKISIKLTNLYSLLTHGPFSSRSSCTETKLSQEGYINRSDSRISPGAGVNKKPTPAFENESEKQN